MLSEASIRKEASSNAVFHRGVNYYREGRVKKFRFDPRARCFSAEIEGEVIYDVAIYLDRSLDIVDYDCDCPAFYEYEGACKHIVALMKTVQEKWSTYFPPDNVANLIRNKPHQAPPALQSDYYSVQLMNLFEQKLQATSEPKQAKPNANTRLIPTFVYYGSGGIRRHSLEFRIGDGRPYVMRDIPAFLDAYLQQRDFLFGKNYTFIYNEAVFDETSAALLQIISDAYRDENYLHKWSYAYRPSELFADKKSARLTISMLLKFLELMADKPFDAVFNNMNISGIHIREGRPPFPLSLEEVSGGMKLTLDLQGQVFYGIDPDTRYIFHQGIIYHVDELFAQTIAPVISALTQSPRPELAIADKDAARFFSMVRPALERVSELRTDPALANKYHFTEPEKRVYFDRFRDGIAARIEFQYDDHLLNPALQPSGLLQNSGGKMLLRSVNEEKQIIKLFQDYQFQLRQGSFIQEDEELIYQFIQEALPDLEDMAELFYSEDFKIRINHSARVFPGVRLDSGSGLLELSLEYHDISPREFIEVLRSYRLKKNYYRLKNGSFLSLQNSELRSVAQLMEELDINDYELELSSIKLPPYRALYLDQAARDRELQLQRNSAFKTLVREIREPEELDYEIPDGILAQLRHYQETGFKWMKSLAAYGFGGILADDMGLGKTLQVLSLLQSEKAENVPPSLVIAPTSLMYHWQDEARRFTPELKVAVIAGNQAERAENLRSLDECDLIVTSYALIKRDFELYAGMRFRYCILDEAQNIKNPHTQVAKTVKQIQAGGRLALTGTPIENSLTELWSIFDFLMPGYLLNHNKFKNRYEIPIVKNNNPEAMQDLKRHIQPFVLRRMKSEVLKELPEKIENQMASPMTGEQRKLYLAYLLQANREFQLEVQKHGFDKSQIIILSILTRLRQICCHPSLFVENYHGGSGKLDLLMEILQDALDSNHRVLVFSQFTTMLGIIETQLNQASISHYYLDGSTPAEKRQEMVQAFNAGQNKVFLLSLKAGGTGLNLTGADVVIHYDPWWNPAVEDQATDRAYRIGQKNVVQVIKLISKDSIEEKIFALQEKKKALIDAVIQPGESFLNKMSEEDIRMLFEI